MNSLVYICFIQLGIYHAVHTQCVNRVVQGPNGPIELLPNQVLVQPGGILPGTLPPGLPGRILVPGPNVQPPCKSPGQPIIFPGPAPAEYLSNIAPVIANLSPALALPNLVSGNAPVYPPIVSGNVMPGVLPETVYSPTVIQDSSVANSLANALQLLVVSSLLSNTLPSPYEPPCYDMFMPGYNYIY